MFDLGWSELLVIGIVALIVVGPKDLPVMFRRLGEFTGKARRMAREFQTAMNDAARDSGVNDVTADLRKLSNPKKYGLDTLRDATKGLTSWHPDEAASGPQGDKLGASERGPHTAALTAERKEARDKIAAATAEAADRRRAAEGPARTAPVPDPAAPAAPKTVDRSAAAKEAETP